MTSQVHPTRPSHGLRGFTNHLKQNQDVEQGKDSSIDLDTGAEGAASQAAPPPPDGGFTAWLHVLLMHFVFFNTWGVANGYGIFQQYYSQTLHESQSSISWIGGLQIFFLFSIGAVAGRLTDAGYFRHIFTLGVFLQVFGLFMTSLCTKYWQIVLAQAVCLGIGNGFAFVPALAILSQYFKKYRAVAVGLAAAGAAVGGLVYPAILNWTVWNKSVGFPWALRIMGFVMLVTYIPCLICFKPRLPPRSTGPWIEWEALKEPPFVLFALSMFFIFWGLYFAFFYLGTFARDRIGISEPIYLLMLLNGVGIVGRIVPSLIADKWVGMLNMLIPISLSASLLVYCWAAVDSTASLYAFAVIYGFIAAAAQAILPAVATTMTPDPSKTGTRTGMILSFVGFANLTGPVICGEIIRKQGGRYLGAQMFAASSIFLGAMMAIAARVAKTGWVLWAKV
jgi:MFS family permease